MDATLSPVSWEHVETLFEEASALPPPARAAFLDAACRDGAGAPDEALREAVDRLLASDTQAGSFFEDLGEAMTRPEPVRLPPPRAGPWKLGAPLGHGGMGEVYLAERAEGDFAQRAAVKLVRPGLGEALIARFRAERAFLAQLEHPGIARLLDGGRASDGRPYLATEYVDGVPITEYCETHDCPVNERLALFVQVCEAVAYAHRNLIVHRDLKPSNVFVTCQAGAPRVALLDFGVAKLLSAEDDVTQTAAPMTPAYAAPEQIAGTAVSAATDVYALGVLLFEMLTGARPHQLTGLPRAAADQTVMHRTARRLSEVAADAALARRLGGDLDQIVAMALRAEPERRYSSAEALGRDVERHLAGLPVEARPDSAGYRAAKFVRRHRAGVAASVVAVVALTIGLGMARWQAVEASRQRDRALETTELLVDLFGDVDPDEGGGGELSAQALLDRTSARLQTGLGDDPATRAAVEAAIGRVYANLGAFDRAEALHRDALALRRRLYPAGHADVIASEVDLAGLLTRRSHIDEAEGLLRSAIADGGAALGEGHPAVASARHALGVALTDAGRFDEAEPPLRRALADRIAALGMEAPETAHTLVALGDLLRRQGRLEAAAGAYRVAAMRYSELYGPNHVRLGRVLNEIGVVLKNAGAYDAAEPYYREGLRIATEAYGPRHPEVALSLGNLGLLLKDRALLTDGTERQRLLDAALPLADSSLALFRDLYDAPHLRVAHTEAIVGTIHLARGEAADAEALLRRSLATHDAAGTPAVHSARPYAMTSLGEALVAQGRADEAVPLLQKALALRLRATPGHWRNAETQSALGAALAADGQARAARRALDEAAARIGEGGAGEFERLARVNAARLAALR